MVQRPLDSDSNPNESKTPCIEYEYPQEFMMDIRNCFNNLNHNFMAAVNDFNRDFRIQMGELREGLSNLRNILLSKMKLHEKSLDCVTECNCSNSYSESTTYSKPISSSSKYSSSTFSTDLKSTNQHGNCENVANEDNVTNEDDVSEESDS